MSDESISPDGYAIASFHMAVGVVQVLLAKGLIAPDEVRGLFDAALVGAEVGPLTPASADARRLLELAARLLLRAAASPPAGRQSPPPENDQGHQS